MSTGPSQYFIDESGHTGDLASARGLDFGDQPIFALAAIGVTDPAALADGLERLRRHHRCGPGELKSSMARLAPFVADLADLLEDLHCPLFVEVVEKRFFVAIHIVNHLLCGGLAVEAVPMEVRDALAEFISDGPSDAILRAYARLCREPSVTGVRQTIQMLWTWFDEFELHIARLGQLLAMEARDRAAVAVDADEFLPLFDTTKRGRKVWMLPNLQSLTNIYARINLSRPIGLTGATLVHDEQLQYGAILEDAKAVMEQLSAAGRLPGLQFADYDLRGAADLRFAPSATNPCLQAADLVAGCVMRFARTAESADSHRGPDLRSAAMRLLGLSDPTTGTGINFVFSRAMLRRMKVPVF